MNIPINNLKKIRIEAKKKSRKELKTRLFTNMEQYYDEIANLENIDYFNKLSDELILQIFKRINRNVLIKFSVVCKRWRELINDESLWCSYDLRNRIINTETIFRIANKNVKVLSLGHTDVRRSTKKYICNYGNLSNMTVSSQLDTFLKDNLRIEYLDLTNCGIDINGLSSLLKHCKNLKRISLESLCLNELVLKYIGENKSLITLNLCMSQGLDPDILIETLSNLKSLESLNIGWSNIVNGREVSLLCKELPNSLTSLNMAGCRTTLTDDDIERLCINCPRLKQLDLSDAKSLTKKSVECIVNNLRNIDYLAFSRCFTILPSSYLLLNNCSKLRKLDLFDLLKPKNIELLKLHLGSQIHINKYPPFSEIARPITNNDKSFLWDVKI